MGRVYPTLEQERALIRDGHTCIAGLDEAGRGAWAGPVAAAAVILPLGNSSLHETLRQVRDSKLCTPRQRDALYDLIGQTALAWAVSLVPAASIDEIGIAAATRQAMRAAMNQLDPAPTALLIDYIRLDMVKLPQRSITKGDMKSLSIASASIMAKVTRDRRMIELAQIYPGYGFARHKGYGTKEHRAALHKLGPAEIHRRSFAPVSMAAMGLHLEERQ